MHASWTTLGHTVLIKIYLRMAEKTVHVFFCYKERIPTSALADLDQARNASVFAGLDCAGWPEGNQIFSISNGFN